MKSDFLLAITQLSAEKNLPKEVVLAAVESALTSAYRKENFATNQNIAVKIDPESGKVEVWAEKKVVEPPSDPRLEISLVEARRIKKDIKVGDTIMVEATPKNAGRIAAQTAKQVILQRLHEAEHSAILEEYSNKEGDIVTGVVQRIEPGQVIINLDRTEAILLAAEQVRNERYRPGQRLKLYILQVAKTTKGAKVILSRSHPNLLRRLFELEVPEVFNGAVEIKAIAREAGFRSKVAVAARQEGIDPVGCCVGLRGIRIQNIVNELNGEKIDVILWHPSIATFIMNALSPAQIQSVTLDETEKIATVVVPDKQLSLAIGKEGQNARLAAKLTGWRIDIKSATTAEAEKVAKAKPIITVEEKEEALAGTVTKEEVAAEMPGTPEEAPTEEMVKLVPAEEKVATLPAVFFEPKITEEKPQLRFAEDTLELRAKLETKAKQKKKGIRTREDAEKGIGVKKRRREEEIIDEEEED